MPSKNDTTPAQPEVIEVEELEKEDGPPSVIEVWQEWRWRRKAANGEVVLTSDSYPTKAEARQAAEKENPDVKIQEVEA